MTSEPQEAFVWVWLPGAEDPVVAGRLDVVRRRSSPSPTGAATWSARSESRCTCRSCRCAADGSRRWPATIAGCIADAGPDAWGQRVILNHRIGRGAEDTAELSQLTYLLDSGSDRIGALDFQVSADRIRAAFAG